MTQLCWKLRKNNTHYCKNYNKCRFHTDSTKKIWSSIFMIVCLFLTVYVVVFYKLSIIELTKNIINNLLIKCGYIKPKYEPEPRNILELYSKYQFILYRFVYNKIKFILFSNNNTNE